MLALLLYLCLFVLNDAKISTFRNELLPYQEFIKIKKEDASCPCSNAELCNNVQKIHQRELFGFAGGYGSNISLYNWTYLTTIAWAPTSATDLMCYAHQNDVRLIASISNYPFTNNVSEREIWIKQIFEQVEYYHFDGVTFDFESPMMINSEQSNQYNSLVAETTQYFHENMPGSQVSVCVAWESYSVDGRQYDYYNLSQNSDLLYIMDYDTQSQNYQHQCLAAANAPYQGSQRGIESYLNLGIEPSKLILGVPFYGYNYSCDMQQIESIKSKYCPIPFDTFRGVNCSDAAGNEKSFGKINALIDQQLNVTEIRWDASMRAPYFNYMNTSNQVYQVWFDDPMSLQLKYQYAKDMDIRGVGPFCFTQLYYQFNENEMSRAKSMWSSFDAFFM